MALLKRLQGVKCVQSCVQIWSLDTEIGAFWDRIDINHTRSEWDTDDIWINIIRSNQLKGLVFDPNSHPLVYVLVNTPLKYAWFFWFANALSCFPEPLSQTPLIIFSVASMKMKKYKTTQSKRHPSHRPFPFPTVRHQAFNLT